MEIATLRPLSLALLATPLILAACSGGGGSGDGGTPAVGAATDQSSELIGLQIRQLGLVYALTDTPIDDSLNEHLSSAHARFETFQSPLAANDLSLLEATLNPPQGCTVEDATYDQDVEADNDLFFVEQTAGDDSSAIGRGEAISAGEALTVMTPVGSWPDLLPSTYFSSGLAYSLDNFQPTDIEEYDEGYNVSDLIQAGSTLDIPGDVFPAFSSIPVGGLTPLRGLSIGPTVNGELQTTSTVRWTPGDNPDQQVTVAFNSDAPFVDDYKHVVCITRDTGSFAMPSEVQSLMNDFVFLFDDISVARESSHYHVSGDALLLVRNRSSAYLTPGGPDL